MMESFIECTKHYYVKGKKYLTMECNYQVRLGWPLIKAYGFRIFP